MTDQRRLGFVWIFSTIFLLASCDDNSQVKDLKTYVDHIRKTEGPAAQKDIGTENKPPVPADYHPDAPRSPFIKSEGMLRGKSGAFSNPLQAYPITMLRFVGTVTEGKETYAYVATPDGLIFQIKQGDVVGNQGGKVVSVTTDRLNVMEETKESGKAIVSRVITLQLKDENE